MKRSPRKPESVAVQKYDMSMGITQSMLSNFTRCRVASRLGLDGWGNPVPRRATQFGSLMHSMLQNHYLDMRADPMDTWLKTAKKWEKTALKGGDKTADIQKDLADSKALFPEYCARWRKDDQKKKWVEVEQVFDVEFKPLSCDCYRLRGKVDGVFQAKDGTTWILETKTASQISDDTMNLALPFDFQCLFYIVALELKLKKKISGVLYNVIRTPQIQRSMDKSSEAYVEAIREDIQKRPDFYFVRYTLTYPQTVQARFRKELGQKLDDFDLMIDEQLPIYRNEFSCRSKWNCEYLPVCSCGGNPEKAGFLQNRRLFSELEED